MPAATTRRSSLNGIPAGGLFTGAEEIKTAEQQQKYGGVAGLALDPATTRPATASTPCGTVPTRTSTGS